MKKVALIILEIIFFISLLLLPKALIRNRLGPNNLHSFQLLPLTTPITFHFTTDKPLNSISFELKNPNLQNRQQVFVDLFTAAQERNLNFFGTNIGDPSRIDLKFAPLDITTPTPITVKIYQPDQSPSPLSYYADQQGTPVYFTTYHSSFNLNFPPFHPSPYLLIYVFIVLFLNFKIIYR